MVKIKFCGKRTFDGKWTYGWLVIEDNGTAWISRYYHRGEWEQVDPETVGQYTGKNDKNGKEIYEKHRVKVQFEEAYFPSIIGEVIFEDGCWMIKEVDGEYWSLYSSILGPIEVIHDNPELLEAAANE